MIIDFLSIINICWTIVPSSLVKLSKIIENINNMHYIVYNHIKIILYNLFMAIIIKLYPEICLNIKWLY